MLFTNEMDDGVLKDILSSLFGEEKKEYSERVKKSLFYDSVRTNVSFKMSNTREALFTPAGKITSEKDLSFGNSIVDGDLL